MAIFYIDFENGNDANDGTTWAQAWKSLTTGATAARTAPGDEIRLAKSPDPTSLGQMAFWTGIDRIYTEITPTSSTNATPIVITKAGHGVVTGDFVQVYGHTVNTNANGKWKATRIDDNQFSLDNSVGNGNGGATGKFSVINHRAVQLTTAVTQDICNCDTAWTAGANCTVTKEATIVKEGTGSAKVVCAAGSGATQILAKFGLPVSLDLSGFQQISLWLQNSAAVAANSLELRLYSDAACTALVETLVLPAMVGVNRYRAIAIDKGSALSATVQGIALYAATTQASKTFYLDNIIACKASSAADSLTLRSLISKNVENSNGDHVFLGIQAIVGNLIYLDNETNSYTYTGRGYSGVTESVTTYKRETIQFDVAAGVAQKCNESGTAGAYKNLIGGWNTVSNLRDGLTIMDGTNGLGYGLYSYGVNFWNFSFLQLTRFMYPHNSGSTGTSENMFFTNNTQAAAYYSINLNYVFLLNNTSALTFAGGTGSITVNNVTANNNGSNGLSANASYIDLYNNILVNNNGGIGLETINYNMIVGTIISASYNGVGVSIGANVTPGGSVINEILKCNYNTVYGIHIADVFSTINRVYELNNCTTGIRFNLAHKSIIYKIDQFNACVNGIEFYNYNYGINIYEITESTGNAFFAMGKPIECFIYKSTITVTNAVLNAMNAISLYFIECNITPASIGAATIIDGRVYFHNYNLSGNHYIGTEYGYIENENIERHTASGMSWKIAPTGILRTTDKPIALTVGKVYCVEGSQVSASCWVKKTHATDIAARLKANVLKNSTISVTVTTVASDTTNWQQLIITLIPLRAGVIEFEVEAYWVANEADEFVYVDDFDVIQLI